MNGKVGERKLMNNSLMKEGRSFKYSTLKLNYRIYLKVLPYRLSMKQAKLPSNTLEYLSISMIPDIINF